MSTFSRIYFVFLFLSSLSILAQSSFEDKLGGKTHEIIMTTQGFYKNDQLLEFVKKVGKKLEAQMPENDYEFKYYLVDTQEPNAFATMGGYVYVTRGLLSILDTEDELACVLGHEFTHVLEKHSTKKLRRAIAPAVLEIPGNMVGSVVADGLGTLLNLPIVLVTEPVGSAFDRKQESVADEKGIELAAKAGYDPYALASALEKLENFVQVAGVSDGSFSIFLDHPVTKKRVASISKLLEGKEIPSKKPQTIYAYTKNILVGANPKEGVLVGENKFVHPDLNFSVQLPKDWKVENTPVALKAMSKKQSAGMVFGINDKHKKSSEAAKALKEEVAKKNYEVVLDESRHINGYTAHEIRLVSRGIKTGQQVIVWIEMLGINGVLQFSGSAVSSDDALEIHKAIQTFKPLSKEDRAKVVQRKLLFEKADGITLEEFAKRKGVEDNIKWMELLNGLKKTEILNDKMVHYVLTEPYK